MSRVVMLFALALALPLAAVPGGTYQYDGLQLLVNVAF